MDSTQSISWSKLEQRRMTSFSSKGACSTEIFKKDPSFQRQHIRLCAKGQGEYR